MDDMVAESKCETPREVLTPLLNLSSGDQRSAQARHVAPKSFAEPTVISLPGTMVQFTNQAKNHEPLNNLSIDSVRLEYFIHKRTH